MGWDWDQEGLIESVPGLLGKCWASCKFYTFYYYSLLLLFMLLMWITNDSLTIIITIILILAIPMETPQYTTHLYV